MMMKRSIAQIIDDQVRKWNLSKEERKEVPTLPVITISREAGSGGRLVAEGLSEKMEIDLFHQEVLNEMAKSANVSGRIMETVDEMGVSMIDDWVRAVVDDRHLWPDEYMQHLLKVIGAIAKHGPSVLVGRGANFVIPREKRFATRFVAPLEFRAQNVAKGFDLKIEEARRRVIRTDSNRKAFIRKYFNTDIANPLHYDLVLNMETVSIDQAVQAVRCLLGK